jgi:hypothetical protein
MKPYILNHSPLILEALTPERQLGRQAGESATDGNSLLHALLHLYRGGRAPATQDQFDLRRFLVMHIFTAKMDILFLF